jgi:tRNA A37 threonylcarbamoyladenosine modification protein TsaB
VRGVSVLEATVSQSKVTTDWAFPMLDARRGEFYLGSFRRSQIDQNSANHPEYDAADTGWLLKPEALRGFISERLSPGQTATCLGRGMEESIPDLRLMLPNRAEWQSVNGALAAAIADVARREVLSGARSADNNLDAYYIRRPDAEVNWKA